MEYSCIYETAPELGVPTTLILLIVVEIILVIYAGFTWKNNEISGKIGLIIVTVLLFLIILVVIREYYIADKSLKAYKDGQFLVAEGIIEDYDSSSAIQADGPDYFAVNSVFFTIPKGGGTFGYPYRQRDGGVLRNGLHCKIYYVPDRDDNLIMKLFIETSSG